MLQAPGICAKAAQVLINADEDFLRQIFRFLLSAGESVAEVENPSAIAVNNDFPGGVVSLEALLDQAAFSAATL